MTGDFVDPTAALGMGLYNRVVPADRVLAEARALAEQLARGPSFALGKTKEALDREATMDLATALAAEAEVQAGCMLNSNFRESYDAFTAKREPRFI